MPSSYVFFKCCLESVELYFHLKDFFEYLQLCFHDVYPFGIFVWFFRSHILLQNLFASFASGCWYIFAQSLPTLLLLLSLLLLLFLRSFSHHLYDGISFQHSQIFVCFLFPCAQFFSWFGSSIPSVMCCFPLFLTSMAHFSMSNSIPMFWLYLLTVYIKVSNSFSFLVNRLMSYMKHYVIDLFLRFTKFVSACAFLENVSE